MSKVIYLIGASGSGKDSVLAGVRQWLNTEALTSLPNLMITNRYICRDWQSGNENHIELSEAEFQRRQQLGCFSLDWQANGLRYGIGKEIDLWLAKGQNVIVNGSREYLPTAMTIYGKDLVPVLIKVETDILRQRLINRGRESLPDIEARLTRTQQQFASSKAKGPLDQCHVINNNTNIDDAVLQLISYLNSLSTSS
ncbi:ribose 1,5-bisphosphokinase [Marinomonas sp. RSW2]|uniref:ribose 1,5-bisphosphate phosphokinase n=1 Tax=Marinomonas maritima TaxID=2940935 RepID=A0ABT5WBF8_9GAMM|nr:ribose 1,5-bisphosphokinase [Marinomonas maritima]MDE8602151.1 ribose 1,5-bisphosphokinase [Marinomonas maritima]